MSSTRKLRSAPLTPNTPETPYTPGTPNTAGMPGTPGAPSSPNAPESSAAPAGGAPMPNMAPGGSTAHANKVHHHHAHANKAPQGAATAQGGGSEPKGIPDFLDFIGVIDLEQYRDKNGVIQCPIPKEMRDKLKYE